MSTPTKKEWHDLSLFAGEELEHAEWELRDVARSIEQRIDRVKKAVDWNWEYQNREGGAPFAIYWDDATDEEKSMLDFSAKVMSGWEDAKQMVSQARHLMLQAYELMNKLSME